MADRPYYLGAPLWALSDWKGNFFSADAKPAQFLAQYARFFNAVEGNTTFYSVPSESMVQRWCESTPASFRFSFKFPRQISHYAKCRHCDAEVNAFLKRLSPLEQRMAGLMLQLPASFSPADMPVLKAFLRALPSDYHYAVEVRHPDFFTDQQQRRRLNEILRDLGVNRVIFESRPVHAAPALDDATREAHERKPRLPVQLDTTAMQPVLRYIGHPVLEENEVYLQPWVAQTARWIEAGMRPRIFLHTPDNRAVPVLARWFHQSLNERMPGLPALPPFPGDKGQGSLL